MAAKTKSKNTKTAKAAKATKTAKVCAVKGCERKHHTRGLCRLHYGRWRRRKAIDGVKGRKRRECCIKGCSRRSEGYGLCDAHLTRVKRTGTSLALPLRKRRLPLGSEVVKGRHIYVKAPKHRLASKSGFVAKSHLEYEQHFGEILAKSDCIKFKDGDCRNFLPGNLYLVPRSKGVVRCCICGKQLARERWRRSENGNACCNSSECKSEIGRRSGSRRLTGSLHPCEYCGKPTYRAAWQNKRKGQVFCSRDCYWESMRTAVRVKCAACGKAFSALRCRVKKSKSGLLYCSLECSSKTIKTRRKPRSQVVQCSRCGRSFRIYLARAKLSKSSHLFCSRNCSNKFFGGGVQNAKANVEVRN